MAQYDRTSTEDLLQKRLDLDVKIQALKEEKRELALAIDARLEQENAQRLVANMSDSEKAALIQVVQAEGIESEEAVNG